MDMDQPNLNKLEHTKLYLEYLRHLTTLSTGSIILIATFLEKLFSNPLWKAAVVVSLVGFMISVLSSVVVYTVTIWFYLEDSVSSDWPDTIHGSGVFFAWIGFLIGILSLGIFALRNLV